MRSRVRQALDHNKSLDFHLIPSLAGFDENGFVVLLREVSSLRQSQIHASLIEQKYLEILETTMLR